MAQRIKIIHFADVHLGRGFSETIKNLPEKRKNARQALRKFFKKALEIVVERKPDIAIIAGDLFDTSKILKTEMEFAANEIINAARLTPDTFFFLIPGGHDHLSPFSPYLNSPIKDLSNLPNVFVASKALPQAEKVTTKDGYDVAVHFFPHNEKYRSKSPLQDLAPLSEADFNIAVAHGSIKEFLPEGLPLRDPISLSEMEKFDYTVLGDWHGYKEIKKGTRLLGCYSGSLSYLDYDEFKKKEKRGVVEAEVVKENALASAKTNLFVVHNFDYAHLSCLNFSEFQEKIKKLDREKIWLIEAALDEFDEPSTKFIETASAAPFILEARAKSKQRRTLLDSLHFEKYDFKKYLIEELEKIIEEMAVKKGLEEGELEEIKQLAVDYSLRALEGEKLDKDEVF